MDCELFKKYIDNYENLTEDEKLEMTMHAAECKGCGRELDFMLSIIETSKSLPKIELSSDFIEKLNVRIDAEERKKLSMISRIASNMYKNRRQYSVAAACLALVAIITSNGMRFVEKMPSSEDGTAYNETQIDNNAVPQITPLVNVAGIQPDVPEEITGNNTLDENSADKTVSDNLYGSNAIIPAMKSSVPDSSDKKVPKNIMASKIEVKQEAENYVSNIISEEMSADDVSVIDNNIAMASITGDESGIMVLSEEPDDIANENRRSVQYDYSIADENELMIAKYEPPAEGEDEDSKKAIGKIKISSEDIDEAMDVIMQHSHDVSGDLYTTDSANLSLMLSSLIQKGVNCTNYTPAYEGNIKFQLVIE